MLVKPVMRFCSTCIVHGTHITTLPTRIRAVAWHVANVYGIARGISAWKYLWRWHAEGACNLIAARAKSTSQNPVLGIVARAQYLIVTEADTGNEATVKETLEDRGDVEPPGWVDEDLQGAAGSGMASGG